LRFYIKENIVILSGSPRKNGNSEKLLTAFRKGAESTGKSAMVYRTAHMKMKTRPQVHLQFMTEWCNTTDGAPSAQSLRPGLSI